MSIPLSSWMAQRTPPIRLEEGRVLTIATDGVSAGKSHVMAIGIVPLTADPPEFIYVAGGDLEATKDITGIVPKFYFAHMVGPARAQEILTEKLEGVNYLVSHSVANFLRRWLTEPAQETLTLLRGFPVFDTIMYLKLRDAGIDLGVCPGKDMSELLEWMEKSGNWRGSQGYSLDAVLNRVIGDAPDDTARNRFEARALDTRRLFLTLMVM